MRNSSAYLVLVFAVLGAAATASAQTTERTFLVRLTDQADRAVRIVASKQGVQTGLPSVDDLNRKHRVIGMERVFARAGKYEARHRAFGLHRWFRITIEGSGIADRVLADYRSDAHIERVERIRSRKLLDLRAPGPRILQPNDPSFVNQWQYSSTGDRDIDLLEAWDLSSGSPDVVVAILDSGADMDHPDLAPNLWVNPGEIPNNGIDDDNNGFVDDVHGWDFSDNDNDPNDTDGHGSHTAGTIAAATHNGIGVSGVAGGFGGGGARIMPLKIFENAYDDIIANAFVYGADNGAVISSNSWGGGDTSALIEDAIDYFVANAGGPSSPINGGVVIFAAGNDGSSSASMGYPGSYAPVIAVAASDQSDRLASWSNYGSWVDITAPGVGILSTVVGGYDSYDGTSMACPHVAGVAALVASYAPGMTAAQVRQILESSADNIDSVNGNRIGQLGSGRLNAFNALSMAVPPAPDNTAPGVISALTVAGVSSGSLDLEWIATGDDGADGRAARYIIRYATSPIVDFETATNVSAPPTPQVSGSPERFTLSGLLSSTTYFVAIRAVDEAGNAGPVSDQASGTTATGPSMSIDPSSVVASLTVGSSATEELVLTNTGSSSLTFVTSSSARSVTREYQRRIDPASRHSKETRRTLTDLRGPIVRLSGGSLLVWDPDNSQGTGEAIEDALLATGHRADYVTDLAAVADLSTYVAVFVTLGMYPDNHVLSRSEGNRLAAYLDGGGRLYLEGGDTWAYDPVRSVHGYFGIEGLDDGTNDLSMVSGVTNTWTAGASWTYPTDPNVADYVDRLRSAGNGVPILRNDRAGYDVAVQTDGGSYRSIGASFAAGALSSSDLARFVEGVVDFLVGGAVADEWLSVGPESGVLAPGARVTLAVSLDASALEIGTYEGTITISAAGGDLRIDVPVTLAVTDGSGGGDPGDGGGGDPGDGGDDVTLPAAALRLDATDLVAVDGQLLSLWPDASGNGHDATQGGNRRPRVLTGWIGDAPSVVFDGRNDYLNIASNDDVNLGDSYDAKTIAIVAETGFDTYDRQVLYEQGGASRGISIYVFSDRLYLAAWNLPSDGGAGAWGPVYVSTDVDPYRLLTVVLTFDGLAGTVSGRVNGVSIGFETGAGLLFRHSGGIGLGAMRDGSRFHDRSETGTGNYWSGAIASMRYYNEALSGAQAVLLETELTGTYYGGLASRSLTALADEDPAVPRAVELGQNYPNPFNPTTTISFDLPAASRVRLDVYDMLGRVVRTLVDGPLESGVHSVTWNGRDQSGASVASGTYLYRFSSGSESVTRTMQLIK